MAAGQVSAGRWLGAVGAVLALATGALTVAAQRAPAASRDAQRAPAAPPAARATRVLKVDDTGHLRLLHASGSILQEEGPASGTLAGTVKVRLVVHATVTATFTIEAQGGGSIGGSGSATLHSSQRYSSFGGSLAVNHGTGRYAHAHGTGELYGAIDRRTDTLTVQTVGQLDY
jgi:hypothetical protein